jgi:imidazole glycerol-phosphate synthase subunit HisH
VMAAFARAYIDAELSADPARIRDAARVVLPGVGSAAAAMRTLRARGLVDVLRALTQPVLGICLGMQLLFEHSDEGDTATLAVAAGTVRRLTPHPGRRVPHMGWNRLDLRGDSPLTVGFGDDPYAYFVHSYAVPCAAHTLASCEHGDTFAAIVQSGNFHGAQFHPERSAAVGARLLRNFASL